MAAVETFRFPSRTRPGHVHIVTAEGGFIRCSCEAVGFGQRCWAVKQVKEALTQQQKTAQRAREKDMLAKMERFARP